MRTIFHLTLTLALALEPLAATAAETTDSGIGAVATSALQGATSVLNTGNNLLASIQGSQTNLQTLATQLSGQNQANQANMNTVQGQFDSIKQQLALAVAETQQCIQKNTRDYSKYKKAPASPVDLNTQLSETPTCSNYGAIIDSARKAGDQLRDTNSKMACLSNMQNKIGQLAESAKQPFNMMTQAATEVWNTRQKIIDAEQGIVDQVDADLNGDNGYHKQLADMESLDAQVTAALGQGSSGSGKDGKGGSVAGITQRLSDLKRQRVNAANSWYFNLMSDVQRCFASDSTKECSLGTAASPAECVRAYVNNVGKGSAPERAQAKANASRLQNTFVLNLGDIKLVDTQANVDVSKPDQFLALTNQRFQQMVGKVTANFNSQNFVGKNVNKSAISNFVRAKYQECYNSAVTDFQADMQAEGPRYKATANAISDKEASLNAEITGLVSQVTHAMNDFRTSFNKNYDRSLEQFANDCTASGSPYASADCLRKVSATLHNDIYGTVSTVSSNGTNVAFAAGVTTLNLQTLSLDASGNPSTPTTPTQCVGFKECINVLDHYEASHKSNVKAQEKSREAFVQTHNKTVDTALAGVTAQFAAMSKLVSDGVSGINTDLANLMVGATVTTKSVESEALEKDETTGLYKTPSSMKAAMAGVGSLVELDTSSVTEAYNTRVSDINDKAKEAAKMKGLCAVKQSDLDAIKNRIGRCDTHICDGTRMQGLIGSLESLLRKSQPVASSDEKGTTMDNFRSCVNGARRASTSSGDSSELVLLATQKGADGKSLDYSKILDAKRDAANTARKEEERSCSQDAVFDLDALAAGSRESMKGTNDKLMTAIRSLSDACSADPVDETAVVDACNDAKKAAGDASPPTDEGESNVDGSSSTETFTNPLNKSAQ